MKMNNEVACDSQIGHTRAERQTCSQVDAHTLTASPSSIVHNNCGNVCRATQTERVSDNQQEIEYHSKRFAHANSLYLVSTSTQFTVVKKSERNFYTNFVTYHIFLVGQRSLNFCCLTFRLSKLAALWPLARYSLLAVSPLIPSVAHWVRFMVYVRLGRRPCQHCYLFARHLHSDACSKQKKI